MDKKTISIILAYVGVLTGAGLASGQEIMQYFISFGKDGLYGLIGIGVLHIFVGGIVLQLGSHFVAQSHIDVLEEVSEKFVTKFMDFALILNCFLMGFVMIAGAGSNLEQQFGLAPWIGSLICTLLIIVVGMMDFEKVTKVIGFFTPLVLVFTLIGAIYTIVKANPDFEALDVLGKSMGSSLPNIAVSTINYFGLCMISSISMAFVLGGSRTDSSQARAGGMLGGGLVAILTALVGLTLFFALNDVKDADIPMQIILNNVHPYMGLAMSLIIFGMIFNTAISLFYSAAKRLSLTEEKFKRNLVIFTLLGFALSFMGFKKLMALLYPILGFLGLILIIILIVAWFKERDAIKSENKKRDQMSDLTRKKLDDDEDFGKKDREKLNKLAEASIIENDKIKEAVEEEVEEELEEEKDN
ncbi:YkvI family membrane protein [Peptoniphilus timonensis]|uniref:YkvI family membrane protein n=1 Tax=Peptoniphilus timonensis TaxID=1268254 RepID=UPI0002E95668|nr:membrane protein [Peptoniphilus timonensis]